MKKEIVLNIGFPKEIPEDGIKEVARDVIMDSVIDLLENDEEIKEILKEGLISAIKNVDFKTVFKSIQIEIK